MKKTIFMAPLLVCITACAPPDDSAMSVGGSALDGAWRLVMSETILPDGQRRPGTSQESFLLFAEGYYSMNWASGEVAAPYFAKQFMPTDVEKVARFSMLLVNAGRYEVSKGVITIHPDFALMPEYVDGFGEFDYQLNGDTLDLEWRTIESADGAPDPNTAVGVRFHYKWVRR